MWKVFEPDPWDLVVLVVVVFVVLALGYGMVVAPGPR